MEKGDDENADVSLQMCVHMSVEGIFARLIQKANKETRSILGAMRTKMCKYQIGQPFV